jgi:periplasmic divalent cation tolerance protein
MADEIVVLTNTPDAGIAEKLARVLVERRLAACVNILPAVNSIYRWQGSIEQAAEASVLIKTSRSCYEALEAAINELHPYDVPEIIALPIVAGLPAYLRWVAQETTGNSDA